MPKQLVCNFKTLQRLSGLKLNTSWLEISANIPSIPFGIFFKMFNFLYRKLNGNKNKNNDQYYH